MLSIPIYCLLFAPGLYALCVTHKIVLKKFLGKFEHKLPMTIDLLNKLMNDKFVIIVSKKNIFEVLVGIKDVHV